jgi:uncharacterized protein HemX
MYQGLGLLLGAVGAVLALAAATQPGGTQAATNTCGMALIAIVIGAGLFVIGKRQAAAAQEEARMRKQAQMIAEEMAKK